MAEPQIDSLKSTSQVHQKIVQKMEKKAHQSNEAKKQIQGLMDGLAGGTVKEEYKKSMTPDQLRSVQNMNTAQIANHIGQTKFVNSERGASFQRSIQTLRSGLTQERERLQQERTRAREEVLNGIEIMGADAFKGMNVNERRQLEREAGFSQGYLDRAQSSLERQEQERQEQIEFERQQQQAQMDIQQDQLDISERQLQESIDQQDFNQRIQEEQLDVSERQLQESIDQQDFNQTIQEEQLDISKEQQQLQRDKFAQSKEQQKISNELERQRIGLQRQQMAASRSSSGGGASSGGIVKGENGEQLTTERAIASEITDRHIAEQFHPGITGYKGFKDSREWQNLDQEIADVRQMARSGDPGDRYRARKFVDNIWSKSWKAFNENTELAKWEIEQQKQMLYQNKFGLSPTPSEDEDFETDDSVIDLGEREAALNN